MILYPLLFEPNLHEVVWGGNQLRPYKGLEATDEPIGESWEVSAVPTSTGIIASEITTENRKLQQQIDKLMKPNNNTAAKQDI